MRGAALGTSLITSTLAENYSFISTTPDMHFFFEIRDQNNMLVDRELNSGQKYTATLWGYKDVDTDVSTFKIQGKSLANPVHVFGTLESISPKEYYTQHGFTNDFLYTHVEYGTHSEEEQSVVNQFEDNSFIRSLSSPSYGRKSGGGIVAKYSFQPTSEILQSAQLSAEITSYCFDGTNTKKEPVRIVPYQFVIVPSQRPKDRSLMLIERVGTGLPHLYATGIGTPLVLQRATNTRGPWTSLYTTIIDKENPHGSLKYIDYDVGMPARFYRVVPQTP